MFSKKSGESIFSILHRFVHFLYHRHFIIWRCEFLQNTLTADERRFFNKMKEGSNMLCFIKKAFHEGEKVRMWPTHQAAGSHFFNKAMKCNKVIFLCLNLSLHNGFHLKWILCCHISDNIKKKIMFSTKNIWHNRKRLVPGHTRIRLIFHHTSVMLPAVKAHTVVCLYTVRYIYILLCRFITGGQNKANIVIVPKFPAVSYTTIDAVACWIFTCIKSFSQSSFGAVFIYFWKKSVLI